MANSKAQLTKPTAGVIPLGTWLAMMHYTNDWNPGNTFISVLFGLGCTYFGYF